MHRLRSAILIFAAAAASLQWVAIHFSVHPGPSPMTACLAGLGIFSAAFLLTWAAELVQFDLPQSIALILVALLAVLPEYAVDMYFAWRAGTDPAYIQYAAANMTGANRLLIGLGWAAVFFAFWLRNRRGPILIGPSHRLEIKALVIATFYSFIIPIFHRLTIFDSVVFLAIFALYTRRAMQQAVVEPELEGGVVELVGSLRPRVRRLAVFGLFAVAGLTIFLSAEPFAEGLLVVGERFGIEKFLLVQWLAPLASEAPEFLIAIIFAWKLKPSVGLGALISSKVNQWTLLVGMLPIVYAISSGGQLAMHLDARQNEEMLLTAAQSLFALVLIADLRFGVWDALLLAVTFLAQLFFPSTEVRLLFAGGYIAAAAAVVAKSRGVRRGLWEIRPWRKTLATPPIRDYQ